MRLPILLCALTGCLSDDVGTNSFGVILGSPEVKFARSTTGLTNYGGVGYYQWNIILSTTDGCDGDLAAAFEINTPVVGSPNAFPTGAIPIRTAQTPDAPLSAFVSFAGATGTTGTITVDDVAGRDITGEFDATLTSGPMSGAFIALRCE